MPTLEGTLEDAYSQKFHFSSDEAHVKMLTWSLSRSGEGLGVERSSISEPLDPDEDTLIWSA